MKIPNVKTMLITAGVTAVILGLIVKSGREAVAKNEKPENTIAGKLGFI